MPFAVSRQTCFYCFSYYINKLKCVGSDKPSYCFEHCRKKCQHIFLVFFFYRGVSLVLLIARRDQAAIYGENNFFHSPSLKTLLKISYAPRGFTTSKHSHRPLPTHTPETGRSPSPATRLTGFTRHLAESERTNNYLFARYYCPARAIAPFP